MSVYSSREYLCRTINIVCSGFTHILVVLFAWNLYNFYDFIECIFADTLSASIGVTAAAACINIVICLHEMESDLYKLCERTHAPHVVTDSTLWYIYLFCPGNATMSKGLNMFEDRAHDVALLIHSFMHLSCFICSCTCRTVPTDIWVAVCLCFLGSRWHCNEQSVGTFGIFFSDESHFWAFAMSSAETSCTHRLNSQAALSSFTQTGRMPSMQIVFITYSIR